MNNRAAELLGWHPEQVRFFHDMDPITNYVDTNGLGQWEADDWNPTEDHSQAAILESEIERRGLQPMYIGALMGAIGLDTWRINEITLTDYWRLITATPAQRTEAFIKTMEDRDE